jgi:hypothetical protein
MAITATIALEQYNLNVKGIYIRISNIQINYPKEKYLVLSVEEYLNATNRTDGISTGHTVISMPMEYFGTSTLFNMDAILTKAYAWLKTQDKYKDAVDC